MISFRPAIRESTPLMIGLAGPSRSGKTFSAHRIAVGLANGGPIIGIDTEAGRMKQYAEDFKFLHGNLTEPFTPDRYIESIQAAMAEKPAVIIIDSVSHMHEGPGGVLEQHDKELDRLAGDDWKKRERMTFSAWIKPKAAVNRFVNSILQMPVHFIFCFRAKDKLKIVAGKDPVHMGWTPICTDRLEYEMSLLLVLPAGSQGTPDLEATSHGLRHPFEDYIKPGVQLDEKLGERLAQWSKGNAARKNEAQAKYAQMVNGEQPLMGTWSKSKTDWRQVSSVERAALKASDEKQLREQGSEAALRLVFDKLTEEATTADDKERFGWITDEAKACKRALRLADAKAAT